MDVLHRDHSQGSRTRELGVRWDLYPVVSPPPPLVPVLPSPPLPRTPSRGTGELVGQRNSVWSLVHGRSRTVLFQGVSLKTTREGRRVEERFVKGNYRRISCLADVGCRHLWSGVVEEDGPVVPTVPVPVVQDSKRNREVQSFEGSGKVRWATKVLRRMSSPCLDSTKGSLVRQELKRDGLRRSPTLTSRPPTHLEDPRVGRRRRLNEALEPFQ